MEPFFFGLLYQSKIYIIFKQWSRHYEHKIFKNMHLETSCVANLQIRGNRLYPDDRIKMLSSKLTPLEMKS